MKNDSNKAKNTKASIGGPKVMRMQRVVGAGI
jgi:hypothetical protein